MKRFLFWFAVAERRQAETHLIILDFVQKKLEFQPDSTANLQFQHFGERLPRGFAARQARSARQSPILRGFATLRVAKKKRLGFGFGSSFARSAKFRKAEPTNLFSFRLWRNLEAIIFNILAA